MMIIVCNNNNYYMPTDCGASHFLLRTKALIAPILAQSGLQQPRNFSLKEDGTLVGDIPTGIDKQLGLSTYRGMLTLRIVDSRLLTLQRQGRIGFYGEANGQEAAVVGSAAATHPQDWIVPALREAGVGLYRGMPLADYVAQVFGNANDPSKGRQMPCHPSDPSRNYVVMSSCVGSQLPHAVGIAWAMRLRGQTGVACIGYCGDGGTSTADFHAALNFAGISKAPVVLICQNNQWAISTNADRQTASETIAQKGLAYGLESLRADGNDLLAVYAVSDYAVRKAHQGGGPTFIELVTYRVGAHSSSDDPARYRDETVTSQWRKQRDPVKRMQAFLFAKNWLTQTQHDQMVAQIEHKVAEVIATQETIGPPAKSTLLEDVYQHPTWLQTNPWEFQLQGGGQRGCLD